MVENSRRGRLDLLSSSQIAFCCTYSQQINLNCIILQVTRLFESGMPGPLQLQSQKALPSKHKTFV